ncbi:hypothetical protein DL93DRAFT_2077414 [Clavulina sp. PMI_390]|nr:hypothetical protein DL93DRAFT_2077414 [Clavulina sp. PMI_390]
MDTLQLTRSTRLVRWAYEGGGSPQSNALSSSTTESDVLTSASSELSFINSQLVAHGFIRPPGLVQPLARLPSKDLELVVQCLRDLLEQRITDMERIEELTSRFRSLGQDHERLIGLHKSANQQIVQARQDCEAAKAKHATTTSQYVELQATHKQTAFNLQRAQSALQFARQTAQNEIKRKDKEIEKIQERWSKLVNDQYKNSPPGGMKCTNLVAGSALGGPRGPSILEDALENLQVDHDRLSVQNEAFRNTLIACARSLDRLSQWNQAAAPSRPVTDLTLFPPSEQPWKSDSENAHKALNNLLLSVESTVKANAQENSGDIVGDDAVRQQTAREKAVKEKMEAEIASLRSELEQSRQALTEQMNGALDAFSRDQRLLRGQPRPSATGSDEDAAAEAQERSAQLDERAKLLEEGQARLAASAIELGKERNAIAAAKLELEEERRAWKLQQLLDELPESPAAPANSVLSPRKGAAIPKPNFGHLDPASPPRKPKVHSPKKVQLRVSPNRRSPRRVVSLPNPRPVLLSDEIIEEEEGLDVESPPPASMNNSEAALPSSSSNPFDQILAQSAQAAQSLSALTLSPEKKKVLDLPSSNAFPAAVEPSVPSVMSGPPPSPLPSHLMSTPTSLSAAQARLKKNPYAPIVPSPLSRILRMADTPPLGASSSSAASSSSETGLGNEPTPRAPIPAPKWTLAKLVEDDDEEGASDSPLVPVPIITLAEELALAEEDGGRNSQRSRAKPKKSPAKRINRSPSPRRLTAKEKGKARVLGGQPRPVAPMASMRAVQKEKENTAPPRSAPVLLAVPSQLDEVDEEEDDLFDLKKPPPTLVALPVPPSLVHTSAPISKKITIGAKVVGGKPITNPPHLVANRGKIGLRPSLVNAGTTGPRSLRERVGQRYSQQSYIAVPRGD